MYRLRFPDTAYRENPSFSELSFRYSYLSRTNYSFPSCNDVSIENEENIRPTRNNATLIYYASKITRTNIIKNNILLFVSCWSIKELAQTRKKKRKKHLMTKIHIDPKDWRDHVQRKLSNALTMARGSRVHTSRLDTCRSLSVCADHFLRMIHRVR